MPELISGLIFVLLFLGALTALALWRAPFWAWLATIAVALFLVQIGIAFGSFGSMGGISVLKVLSWLPLIAAGAFV